MAELARELFAHVVRREPVDLGLACLLIGTEVDPGLDVETGLTQLNALAAAIPPPKGTPAQIAAALQEALGERRGFSGSIQDYGRVEASLLHLALRRRSGLPLTLCVLWLEVARRLGVPAYGFGCGRHFFVAVGNPGQHVIIDPFSGGGLVDERRVAELGGVALTTQDLQPWSAVEMLLRMLVNLQVAARELPDLVRGLRVQLWATELALLLPQHPADLRRERGRLLVRLGDFSGGAAELEQYAAAVAPVDMQAADSARRAAGMARARLN